MNDPLDFPALEKCLSEACHELKNGNDATASSIRNVLSQFPELAKHDDAILDLAATAWKMQLEQGSSPPLGNFVSDLVDELGQTAEFEDELMKRMEVVQFCHASEIINHVSNDPEEATNDQSLDTHTKNKKRATRSHSIDWTGRIVGPFKLEKVLGSGGMGVVYLAHQMKPINRKVAIKFIRQERRNASFLDRFELERQSLSLMDHGGIAKLIDAGELDGTPYYVMDYVEGEPITKHCLQHELAISKRLQLFQQVCEAVQHAHQRGIIHRDLKPSNILVSCVDGKSKVKVIDFGLAKVIETQEIQDVANTNTGDLVGTLGYMSPEQASLGRKLVDTRSDVFSLGVLLFELLTDTTRIWRFDPEASDIGALFSESKVCKPSFRLAKVLERTKLSGNQDRNYKELVQRRIRNLKNDLDWITAKAMNFDRDQRYQTVAGLSDDLARFLNSEPVAAGPPSVAYRARKFFAKYKTFSIALGSTIALLILASVVAFVFAIKSNVAIRELKVANKDLKHSNEFAEKKREEAETAAIAESAAREKFEKMSRFNADLFKIVDPKVSRSNIDFAQYLQRSVNKAEKDLGEDPQILSLTLASLGEVQVGLGAYQDARDTFKKAWELDRKDQKVDDEFNELALKSLNNYGVALSAAGDPKPASEVFRVVFERARKPALKYLAAANLAAVLHKLGENFEALSYGKLASEKTATIFGATHEHTLEAINTLSLILQKTDNAARVISLLRSNRDNVAESLGKKHPSYILATNNLGKFISQMGQANEARQLLEEADSLARELLDESHPISIKVRANIILANFENWDWVKTIEKLKQLLQQSVESLGANHEVSVAISNQLGYALLNASRFVESVDLFEDLLAKARLQFPDHNPNVISAMEDLASAYEATQQPELMNKALEMREKVVALRIEYFGSGSEPALISSNNYALLLHKLGQSKRGVTVLTKAIEDANKSLGRSHQLTLQLRQMHCRYLVESNEYTKAQQLLEALVNECEQHLEENHKSTLAAKNLLAITLGRNGFIPYQIAILEELVPVYAKKYPAGHPDTLTIRSNLADAYRVNQQFEESIKLSNEVLVEQKRTFAFQGSANSEIARTLNNLGWAHVQSGDTEKGSRILEEALEMYRASLPKGHPAILMAAWNCGLVYMANEKFPAAEIHFREVLPFWRESKNLRLDGLLAQLALSRLKQSKFELAQKSIEDCLAIREKRETKDWRYSFAIAIKAAILTGVGELEHARILLKGKYDKVESGTKQLPKKIQMSRLLDIAEWNQDLYFKLNNQELVDKWSEKINRLNAELNTEKK